MEYLKGGKMQKEKTIKNYMKAIVKMAVCGMIMISMSARNVQGEELVDNGHGFSTQTEGIVEAHMEDFNYDTFDSFMASNGGAEEYVRSLGGVFSKWCGVQANVQTAGQFQEIAEYVIGIMTIWGPDYHGGSGDHETNIPWGHGRFYEAQDAHRSWKLAPLEDVYFSNKERIVTDCGCGAYYVLQKAGLCDKYAGENDLEDAWKRVDTAHGGTVIDNLDELETGDMIQMFKESGWGHVCLVGEKHGNTVITYDTGTRFVKSGNCRCVFTVDEDGSPSGDYAEYKSWFGMRMRQLDQTK